MKIILTLLIITLFIISCKKDPSSVSDKINVPSSEYKLVWADEFDGQGLPNAVNWSYEVGHVRNNETQYYVSGSTENSRVENGILYLIATNTPGANEPVKSASIITKDKIDFQYGKIEVRAKFPKGAGTWPAIWTLGKNREAVGWPACGEIDIMEWLGFIPDYIFGSIHKGNSQNIDNPLITPFHQIANDLSDNFHTYSIEWDSSAIKYYIDNINYATYTASEIAPAEWQQFTKPHYLLLNLALGGTSGGNIDYTKFPFVYQIDYVRYYKKN